MENSNSNINEAAAAHEARRRAAAVAVALALASQSATVAQPDRSAWQVFTRAILLNPPMAMPHGARRPDR